MRTGFIWACLFLAACSGGSDSTAIADATSPTGDVDENTQPDDVQATSQDTQTAQGDSQQTSDTESEDIKTQTPQDAAPPLEDVSSDSGGSPFDEDTSPQEDTTPAPDTENSNDTSVEEGVDSAGDTEETPGPSGSLGSPCASDNECLESEGYSCVSSFCTRSCWSGTTQDVSACDEVAADSILGDEWACPADVSLCLPGETDNLALLCSQDSACSAVGEGYGCAAAFLIGNNTVDGVCLPSGSRKAAGENCADDNECASFLCMEGDTAEESYCSAHCNEQSHCQAGYLCTGVGFYTTTSSVVSAWAGLCIAAEGSHESCASQDSCPAGELCETFINPSDLSAEHLCITGNSGGDPAGNACENSDTCFSGICAMGENGIPGYDGICTEACPNGDADCPDGLSCASFALHNNGTPEDATDDPTLGLCMPGAKGGLCLTGSTMCDDGMKCTHQPTWPEAYGLCENPTDGKLGAPCAKDEDCLPTGDYFCLADFCTASCTASADAEIGVCTDISADNVMGDVWSCPESLGFCLPGPSGAAGTECGKDATCSDIEEGQVCTMAYEPSGTDVNGLCMAAGDRKAAGESCMSDGECASLICLEPSISKTGTCSAHCDDASDCPLGNICAGVGFATSAGSTEATTWAGLCVDVHDEAPSKCGDTTDCDDDETCTPYIEPLTLHTLYWCVGANEGGALAGESCHSNADCFSNLCAFGSGNSENPAGYCTHGCPTPESDCEEGMVCMQVAMHNGGSLYSELDDDTAGWCIAGGSGNACGEENGNCDPGLSCVIQDDWIEGWGLCSEGDCVADCAGKSCGDDGCGGSCGTCGAGQLCYLTECYCLPNHHEECVGDHLYWIDSCGNSDGLSEFCLGGCVDAACVN